MRKRSFLVTISILALISVGCSAKTNSDEFSDWSGAPENIVLGEGMADYNNGFLYYTDNRDIFEYDLLSGKSVRYDVPQALQLSGQGVGEPQYLNAEDDGILFNVSYEFPVYKLSFDNQKVSSECEPEENSGWIYSYLEGEYLYGQDGAILKRCHRKTGQVENLAERVVKYCKEKDALYYVAETEEDPNQMEVFRWKDGEEQPEKLEVGMNPISICEEDGKLYMAEYGTYQLYAYDMKEVSLEMLEGVCALSYQIRDNSLFYANFVESDNPAEAMMCNLYHRNLKTGKDMLLKEQVQFFVCAFSKDAVLCFDYNLESWDPYLITLDGDEVKEVKLPLF